MKTTHSLRSVLAAGLTLATAAATAELASAQQYTAIKLHPQGFTSSEAFGISGGQEVGAGTLTSGGQTYNRALLWFGPSSLVNLHPTAFQNSAAFATDGTRQVGVGKVASGG